MDRLLDLETKMRNYGFTLDDVREVMEVFELARDEGHSPTSFVRTVIRTDATGITELDDESASWVISCLAGFRDRKWDPGELASCLTQLHNAGFFELSQDDIKYLPKWFLWAKERRRRIFRGGFAGVSAVCAYVEGHARTIDPFINYLRGRTSLQQLLDCVRQYES